MTTTPARSRRTDAEAIELGQQHGHRALAAGLDQHRGVAFDEIAGGDPFPTAEQGVQLDHPVGHAAVPRAVVGGASG